MSSFNELLDEMDDAPGIDTSTEESEPNLQVFGPASTGAYARSLQGPDSLPMSQLVGQAESSSFSQQPQEQAPWGYASPAPLTPSGSVNHQVPLDGPMMPFVPNPPNLATSEEAAPSMEEETTQQKLLQMMMGAGRKANISETYQKKARTPNKENPSGY